MGQIEGLLVAVTVILLAAWVISRLTATRPSVCDFVWRSALVLIVLTPGVVTCRALLVDWQLRVAVLPANNHSPMVLQTTRSSGQQESLFRTAPKHRAAATSLPTPVVVENQPIEPIERSTEVTSTGQSLTMPSLTSPRTVVEPSRSHWTWGSVVMIVWLTGVALHLITIPLSARNGVRLQRASKPLTDVDCLTLHQVCAVRVGLRATPLLSVSPNLTSPVVVGFLRPQIVIPPSLLNPSLRQDLKAVLLHECGHLRRYDLGFDLLLRLALAMLWPHPLMYVLASEIRRLREEMCDNYVLAQETAVQYAETLLRVAVGKRLNEALLLGIGVVSKPHRLEQRVASLLSPKRCVKTSVPRLTRLIVVGVASGLLTVGLMVRLTSAEVAPPVSLGDALPDADEPAAKPAAVATADPVRQAFEKAVAAAVANPVEIAFRLIDMQDKPVVGARVLPGGVADFRGAFWAGDKEFWRAVESDANGFVRFPIPLDVVKQAIAIQGINGDTKGASSLWGHDSDWSRDGFPKSLQKLGIRQLYLTVDHPDHPLWRNYLELKLDAQLQLADSFTVVARGRRVDETGLAQRVVPWFTGSHSTDWTEEAGVVTYRRVNLTDQKNRPCLQLIQFPDRSAAWFSDIVDLKHLPGNPVSLDLTLKRGVRLEGRLADEVPRPVKNGMILGKMVHLVGDDSQGAAWSVATKIEADGSFVLESLPLHQTLQLTALCDGWNSRSPLRAEFEEFQARHHFPREEIGFASAASVFPRLVRVEETDIHGIVVPMDQTTSCEITAVDGQNRPVAGVRVQFNPNQRYFHWGATLLGAVQDDATRLREQQMTGKQDNPSSNEFNQNKYSGETDADGKVTISDLPCAASDAPPGHELATFFATHEQFVAQSPVFGNMQKIMGSPFLAVKLAPGDPAQVTLRMVPRGIPQFSTGPDSEDEGPSATSLEDSTKLSGRVEDDQGQPLEGVKVLLVDEDCYGIRTDSQGEFQHRLDPEMIEPGEVAVLPLRFVKEGFAPVARDIRVGSREETIQLHRNTWFEGTVRKPDGAPAALVPVRAFHESYSSSLQSELNLITETMTDAEGRYRLLVEPSDYRIIAGLASAGVAWIPKDHSGHQVKSPQMSISPGEHRSLDIQLEPGVQFVAELIDTLTGKSIPDAALILYNNADQAEGTGQSDANGTVMYPMLPTGKLTFQVYSPNHLRWKSDQSISGLKGSSSQFVPTNKPLTFDLRPGMPPVQIVLEAGVEVSGIVLDPQGLPASATEVYLAIDSSDASAKGITQYPHRVDQEGRFRFRLPVSNTLVYHLVAQPQRQNGKNDSVAWSSGISRAFVLKATSPIHDLEIRLTKPGAVRGRVVDRQGRPVASVFVQASAVGLQEPSESCPSTICQRDGTFELKQLRPGRYWLHGKSVPKESDLVQTPFQVDVHSDETSQIGEVVIPVDETAEGKSVD